MPCIIPHVGAKHATFATSFFRVRPSTVGAPKTKRAARRPPVAFELAYANYFIIAAATFLNALMSFSMKSSVYVGCVQNEIVASASECATGQLTFV